MGCFLQLNNCPQVVQPVQTGRVSFKAGKKAVDHVGASSDGLGKFVAYKVGGVVNGQFDTILVLHEGEVFLDVVAESEDIGVFAPDG